MKEQPHKPAAGDDAEIRNAIAAFEKILEALPNDRMSLETLADAYEKIGDQVRATEYTLRLANVFIDEGEEDAARDLVDKVRKRDPANACLKDILPRFARIKTKKVMAVVDDDEKLTRRSAHIANEIAFAWTLFKNKKLSQEDYASVIRDLSENSAKVTEVPVSTLHAIHDRNHPALNEIIMFAADACKTPFISLASFEFQPKVAGLLPLDFCIKHGVIIFETMRNDVLAGILNPYDAALISDIEEATGKTCHCYLVTPTDFDSALDKMKKSAEPEKG